MRRMMLHMLLAVTACLLSAADVSAQQDSVRTLSARDSLKYCMKQGRNALRARRPEAAFRWYRRAVRYEEPSAYLALGNCYYYGYGTQRDFQKAYNWFYKAAMEGNTMAEYRIGQCYHYGYGTHRDARQAPPSHRPAAEKGRLGK